MKFLFWNIRGKSMFDNGSRLLGALSSMINAESLDVIALAEYQEYSDQLDDILVQNNHFVRLIKLSAKEEKVDLFYNPEIVNISILCNGKRSTALKLTCRETGNEIYGYFCHLPSKLHMSSDEQRENAASYMCEVREFEENANVEKVFICGDFNMSPYEEGMVSARAFHAIMDSKVVGTIPMRSAYSIDYTTYYNPMWGLAGDIGKCNVSGTYYNKGSKAIEYFWYLFDQVIMRPALIPYFDKSKLKIITQIGEHNLLDSKGRVNLEYSDHLPICFTFNF